MNPFEEMLEEMTAWRHRDIWSRLPRRRHPRKADRLDGFLPYAKAAAVMGVSETEVVELGLRGMLEIDVERELVRPAVMSVLGVRAG